MAGARRVQVRSFGSEVPEPDVRQLAGWVERRRGIGGDLTSYFLEESLDSQEGVDLPCTGGRIYRGRILETLGGIDEGILVEEPSVDTAPFEEDARWGVSRRQGLCFSIPAPHLLGIRDGFYHDREDLCEGLSTCYRQIMRAMRDSGAGGHVILGDRVHEEEMEHLAGPNSFFFHPELREEGIPALLEFQSSIAVPRSLLPAALEILDEYEVRHISVVDGRREDILAALERLDPEQVSLGGYCREDCGGYWKGLLEGAVIPR